MADDIQDENGTGSKASKESKRPRNIKVDILERQDQTALVEYDLGAGRQRVFVPANLLRGNDIDDDVLAAGIPYGEDWMTWIDEAHGEAFAAQLHATGIYTKNDLLTRSNEVRATLQRLLVNPLMTELLKRAGSG